MHISFTDPTLPVSGTVAADVYSGGELSSAAIELDKLTGGTLSRAIKADRFNGDAEQLLNIVAPANTDLERIVLFGLGDKNNSSTIAVENAGGLFAVKAANLSISATTILLDTPEQAAHFAYGVMLGGYRFDKYRTKEAQLPSALTELRVGVARPEVAEKLFGPLLAVAEGVYITRDLIWEPANEINPESYAHFCRSLTSEGLEVEILGEEAMHELGMGALLGVGQGSDRQSQLVILKHNGGGPVNGAEGSEAPIAFIGKGVTFDTGGLSLKPSVTMDTMKQDMGGAATVTGLMVALSKRRAKVNAVGVLGLVENMPDSKAQRPSDVVKTMSGQTVEVMNTDAEGRLVLCDALTYTQRHLKPRVMIDIATLTSAIVIALGEEIAGVFSNNDELVAKGTAAGDAVEEPVWRMPMGSYFSKRLTSDIADMRNNGNKPRLGGSGVAGQFLHNFIENDTPWVHLDIAGTAWTDEDFPTKPKGATAFGVRLLDRMVLDYFEK